MTMDMSMELYFEINGVKYQVDPSSCSLDFTASKLAINETKACLKITADGKSVYVDLI